MEYDQILTVRDNKTVYRKGDLCLKVFREGHSKVDVLYQALNQARVEETELNIPKVEKVTMIDGKWTIVTEFIEGPTLEELMIAHPEQWEEHLELFVDLQIRMHQQTCPQLNKLKDKMNRKINEADLSETVRYDLHTRLAGMPRHAKLCHGDFNPSNIIFAKDGSPYILDWSHVTQGNASADVARTYLLFCLQGKRKLADAYLNLFCQKSGTEKQYVQKWMPIVAASQSVKGNAEEREFLASWFTVVEYE